jgi:tetratricopeptide (TPR) repeat protein
LNKGGHRILSDQQIQILLERAETLVAAKGFAEALRCYDQLIGNAPSHPHFFKGRGFCKRMLGNMYGAINDYDEALRIDPDDGDTYWERGACYNDIPYLGETIDPNQKRNLLEKALKDYRSAIQRIPTSEEAWLAILDIDLCLCEFDDAISDYGACKPYIHTREYQVVRSWYGCLAFSLAGDPIEEGDISALNDQSVRLRWQHWTTYSIDELFIELEQRGFDKDRIGKAKPIHQKFIDHFDEPPIRFDSRSL